MPFNTRGFTLLEILIALAISAILMSLSSVSYQHYLIKASRMNGKITLLQIASRIEDYYSEHYTYTGATLNDLSAPSMTDDGRYRISLSHLTDSTYLLSAIPQGAQLKDKKCGTLMLNEKNEQLASQGQVNGECWG